eukprot:scaffold77323_cov20-Tisochrysis_lutea.AAC.3
MQCVSLKPDWSKGYSRLSAAYFGKTKYDEAIQAAEEGEQHVAWRVHPVISFNSFDAVVWKAGMLRT